MKNTLRTLIGTLVMCFALSGVCFAETVLEGDEIDYDFRTGQATVKGHVLLTRDDGSKVESAAGEYNTKSESGRLTGGVVATQPDGKATCNILEVKEAGDHLTAIGNAVLKKQDKTLRANQVEYYGKRKFMETVGPWAQLSLDDGSTLDAAYINYDDNSGIANAKNNVRINSTARNLTARGDNAIYNTKVEEGTIELIGNARATQDGNTITGNKLTLRGAGGKIAEGDGNVKLVYFPKPTEPKTGGTETLVAVKGSDQASNKA